jgi:response regulator of citrate/malate metabolism
MSDSQKLSESDVQTVDAGEVTTEETGVVKGLVKKRTAPTPTPEFIHIWNQAESVDEVSQKTGLSHNSVSTRASTIRKNGVVMKEFPRGGGGGPRLDWDELRKMSQQYAPQEQS